MHPACSPSPLLLSLLIDLSLCQESFFSFPSFNSYLPTWELNYSLWPLNAGWPPNAGCSVLLYLRAQSKQTKITSSCPATLSHRERMSETIPRALLTQETNHVTTPSSNTKHFLKALRKRRHPFSLLRSFDVGGAPCQRKVAWLP